MFVIPFVLWLLLTGAMLYLNYAFTRHRINENYRKADFVLAGKLKETFPELSDEEIVRAIGYRDDGKETAEEAEAFASQGKELLSVYGYDEEYESDAVKQILKQSSAVSFAILFFGLAGLSLIFYLRFKRRTEEIDEITGYVRRLNEKNYDLMLADNTEEGLSLLRNEVYKTTVMLREIAENKTEETKRLSASMEDISHQLRTPLASMSIMIDNICDDPDMPAELRNEFLHDISGQVNWISELVNSLLKLAKFDAGTIVMKQEEVDAGTLLADAAKRLEILMDVRDVHVEWEGGKMPAPGEIVFAGDYKWQLEAVSNIMKNCAEHSPAGSALHLSAEQNSIYTKLVVRDEGEGIGKEDLRHIFERFYKAKTARPESIGIGLSLAKSIVEAGHGYITVDSEEGKGSTFEIKYMK